MNADPGSLERLHDIVLPPPAPWWPPAPGWLWLLAVAAVVAVFLAVHAVIRWQRNRYRREALAALARLERAIDGDGAIPPVLQGVAVLLKRVALTAWPRERVATLTGPAWFDFLDRAGGTHFGDGLGAALEAANYEGRIDDWDAQRLRGLVTEARRWVRHHRVLPDAA